MPASMAKDHAGRLNGRERHRLTIAGYMPTANRISLCSPPRRQRQRRRLERLQLVMQYGDLLRHHPGVNVRGGALSASNWSYSRYGDLPPHHPGVNVRGGALSTSNGSCGRYGDLLRHHPGVSVRGGALSASSGSCGRYGDLLRHHPGVSVSGGALSASSWSCSMAICWRQ
jgi:hypothetical protein